MERMTMARAQRIALGQGRNVEIGGFLRTQPKVDK
jgi:hypothetical protein